MTASRLAHRDVWTGALLVAVGGAIVAAAASHRIGTLARPGSGFLGFGVGVVIAVMGAAVLIGALRAVEMPSLRASLAGMRSAPAMLIPMIAFCLVLERIGYLLAGFLMMWFLFAVAGDGFRAVRPVLYGLVATGLTWLLFDKLLGSGLPGFPA